MKNIIWDFKAMTESVKKQDRRHDYAIEYLEVYEDYLYCKRKYIDHPHHCYLEHYLFPNEHIAISKLYQFEDAEYDATDLHHYYVDIVSVRKSPDMWDAKDLYIDFIIMKDGKYYVVDIDEFNEAISSKDLDETEIESALNGLDNILKGYYKKFDIDAYIEELKGKYKHEDKIILSRTQPV